MKSVLHLTASYYNMFPLNLIKFSSICKFCIFFSLFPLPIFCGQFRFGIDEEELGYPPELIAPVAVFQPAPQPQIPGPVFGPVPTTPPPGPIYAPAPPRSSYRVDKTFLSCQQVDPRIPCPAYRPSLLQQVQPPESIEIDYFAGIPLQRIGDRITFHPELENETGCNSDLTDASIEENENREQLKSILLEGCRKHGEETGTRKDNVTTKSHILSLLGSCSVRAGEVLVTDHNTEFMRIAAAVTDMILEQPDQKSSIKMALEIAKILDNHRIIIKAMIGVMEKQPSLKHLLGLDTMDLLPSYFLTEDTINAAQDRVVGDKGCVKVDDTMDGENGDENLLFYIREDIGVNSHHANWHSIHPHTCDKDRDCHHERRGELFYSMHRQMLARYDTERLAHCLPPLSPYKLREGGIIDTNYTTHLLLRYASSQKWDNRASNVKLPDQTLGFELDDKDHNCTLSNTTLSSVVNHLAFIERGVNAGCFILPNGTQINITIDNLGDMLEASSKSPSKEHFGSTHNLGHDFISRVNHPDELKAPVGVMGDTATAMRDPIFYRWHLYINNVFDAHKRTLPSYGTDEGEFPLRWSGIHITDVEVIELAPDISDYIHSFPNQLRTFWAPEVYTVSKSTLSNRCPATEDRVKLCSKQLDHEDFGYRIRVYNTKTHPVTTTVRIFLAPRHDEAGNRLKLVQQRKYLFAMDVFNRELQPGYNLIRRHSAQSVVTTARGPNRLLRGVLTEKATLRCNTVDWKCLCGWPHNLLLPKGKPGRGMEFDLIILLTDNEKYPWNLTDQDKFGCKVAPIMCSLPGRKYPDLVLPMGYPFDREPYKVAVPWGRDEPVQSMEDYVAGLENMITKTITITHFDTTVDPKSSRWDHLIFNMPLSRQRKSSIKTLCRHD